jgi:uncharacterized protein (DUF1800 family)
VPIRESFQKSFRESFRACLTALLCSTLCTPAQFGIAQSPIPSASQNPGQGNTASSAGSSALLPTVHGRRPEYKSDQIQGDERILHALNRFTFGPRPGDVDAVRAMGLDAWFNQQLHPANLDETELNARLADFPAMQWSTQNLLYRVPSNAVIRQVMNGRGNIPEGPILHAVYENQIYRLDEKRQAEAEKKAAQAGNQQPGAGMQTGDMSAASGINLPSARNAAPAQSDANSMGAPGTGAGIDARAGAPASSNTASNAAPDSAPTAASNPPVSSATILNQLDQLSVSAPQQAEAQPAAGKQPSTEQPVGAAAGEINPGNAAATTDPVFIQMADLLALPPGQRVARLAAMQPEEFDSFIKALRPPQRVRLETGMTPALRETVLDLENPQRLVAEELMAQRLARDIYSNAQLQEVMTDFWLNHFNVYLHKDEQTPYYLVSYERDVIRPLAMGKFEDLLEAVAHSPAMLLYLDNAESIGPDSPAAERTRLAQMRNPSKGGAPQGLNENYARELMELHTLGVNGGYTQADVQQVARVLTGWTVDQPQRGGGYLFAPNRHEPGSKKVMGKKIKDNGEREGEELLHMLAARPATAQFISRKLAIRFVSDNPPQPLVDRMAKSYLSSHGDISAVLLTLFRSPEFWSASDYRAKVKTPIEFVVSAARASNAQIQNYQPLENALHQMGMPLYGCVPPTGYKWEAADWVSTGALVDRMNFALNLAANRLPGITVAWSQGQPGAPSQIPSAGMLADPSAGPDGANPDDPTPENEEARLEPLVVAGGVSPATRSAALQQFQAQMAQDTSLVRPVSARDPQNRGPQNRGPQNRAKAATALERQDQVLAGLLIGSPEFQRR